ncbi:MAG: DUF1844 domain-containing protein [Candidatus Thorarchaeota archaeon]
MVKGKKKGKAKPKGTKPEPEIPTETAEQEAAKPQIVDISALPVWQILPFFIRILDSVAWQKMGLVVNPMTQEVEKDLNQARAAIDSYEALLNQLGDQIETDTKAALKSRLADLKLNFATHS